MSSRCRDFGVLLSLAMTFASGAALAADATAAPGLAAPNATTAPHPTTAPDASIVPDAHEASQANDANHAIRAVASNDASGAAGSNDAAGATDPSTALRVCADPDNLPYSREDGSGFENRIARLVAADLHRQLQYTWQPQRRGFVRKGVGAGLCDIFIGVPAGFDRVLTTRPYYRSGYVFVNRADATPPLDSFDDPRLPRLAIGVQLIGNDLEATPPGYALARHGAVDHVVGYTVYGDGPAAERATVDLAAGRLDAALLWGPQAGYFAAHSRVALRLAAAHSPADVPMPFEFAIAMGVKKGDTALRQALNELIERRRADIDAILDAYAVPRLPLDGGSGTQHAANDEVRVR